MTLKLREVRKERGLTLLDLASMTQSIGQNSEFRVLKPILAPEITEVFTNLP
jgi:hypothetical protein